jgi:hypothetical protein
MAYRTRIKYTSAQKQEMYRPSSSIFGQLAPTGGIRPTPRKRSRLALSLSDREEISRGIAASQSLRQMATSLNRAPSTISREIQRNGGYHCYRATQADQAAWDRAHRPKPCKLACHPALTRRVAINYLSKSFYSGAWGTEKRAAIVPSHPTGDTACQTTQH